MLKKIFIKEARNIKLRDVRVQQKTERVRLTSIMNEMQLSSINLDKSQFTINMTPDGPITDDTTCIQDFKIELKLEGAEVAFQFQQWLEAESSTVEEEWGVGSFTMTDAEFNIVMVPYIQNNNFRLRILEDTLTMQDYKYVLRTEENSKFEDMLVSSSSVFSEHMRQQAVSELSTRFASVVQKGIYGIFRRLQQYNRVDESNIYMNKHANLICYVPGSPITESDPSSGETNVVGRHPGSIGFEFQGTFQRK